MKKDKRGETSFMRQPSRRSLAEVAARQQWLKAYCWDGDSLSPGTTAGCRDVDDDGAGPIS